MADLDEPHIRLLEAHEHPASPSVASINDPGGGSGLTSSWALLSVLARHQLISGGYEVLPPRSEIRPDYTITEYGEWFLTRLVEFQK